MDSVTSTADLVRVLRERRHAGRSSVLATLVRVVGPAFRPLGSRMLVGDDGARVGDLSGGCLDDDVASQASALFGTGGARRLVYDGERIADLARGFATGCPRRVEILLQANDAVPLDVLEEVADWRRDRRSGVVLTVFGRDEPTDESFSPITVSWASDRIPSSASGDPRLDREILRVARARADEPTTGDVMLHVGDTRLRALAEVVRPRPRLVTIGGSAIVLDALHAMARALDWEIVGVAGGGPTHDVRPADERTIEPDDLDSTLGLDDRTAAVVLTHHNARDARWIEALSSSAVAYVGVMGSRRRLRALFASMDRDDHDGRLHAPVGLDLGGRDPGSMALSILSEMQAVLEGRTARPLREGLGAGDTAAVVLAAGASRRLGTAKQLMRHGRRSLLRRTVAEVVATGCRPVVVVLGAAHERMQEELRGLDVSVCVNEAWEEGMGTSLARGIAHMRDLSRPIERVLITLCDQPAVDASLLRELLETHVRAGRSMTASAYAETLGVPAVFESGHFDALAAAEGDHGARELLRDASADVHAFPFAAGALDVDRKTDLGRR